MGARRVEALSGLVHSYRGLHASRAVCKALL